jgi:hypothetical protein
VYALRVLKSSRIDLELFNEGDHSMSEVEHHILPSVLTRAHSFRYHDLTGGKEEI